jgi:hypothetical protein
MRSADIWLYRAAFVIEPSLRGQSLKNGNIRGAGRRLLVFWPTKSAKWEGGDYWQVRESPLLAALSRAARGVPANAALPGWGSRNRTSIWQVRKRMLLPAREDLQNPHFDRPHKRLEILEFRNRTEWMESRASERNEPFGEQ